MGLKSRDGEIAQQKEDLRKGCFQKQIDFLKQHDAKIIAPKVLDFLSGETGLWGGYMPLKTEPSLQEIYSKVNGVTWAFPRVSGEDLQYWKPGKEGSFVKSKMGILEPDVEISNFIDASALTGVLVPGIAFDRVGHRLGRGRGFYDRFLKSFQGKKVGVCFSIQLLSHIPHDDHDTGVDVVITEKEIFNISA